MYTSTLMLALIFLGFHVMFIIRLIVLTYISYGVPNRRIVSVLSMEWLSVAVPVHDNTSPVCIV